MTDRSNEWHIKNVSPETKRKIKLFAVAHDLTLAEALALLVEQAAPAEREVRPKQSGTKYTQRTVTNSGNISTSALRTQDAP